MSFIINKSKQLTELTDIEYSIIKCFINFCNQYLNIGDDIKYTINLFSSKDDDKPTGITLAMFDMESLNTWVRCNGRFVYDICRSIAHELVHLKQMVNNEINMNDYTDIGGKIEDEANSLAGIICKEFTKKYNCRWIYDL